jgi:outer membrane protein assembly factor BamB
MDRLQGQPAEPPPASVTAIEWTQDAHDAQRSGYTLVEPKGPWTLAWTWNGPDERGGTGGHFYDAPRDGRTVTGGAFVYVPAGKHGLYALDKATGKPAWRIESATVNAAPAYDPAGGHLFAGAADGRLLKITAKDGRIVATYDARSPLNKAILLAEGAAFVVDDAGVLHRVSADAMKPAWTYAGKSPVATPAAYSAARQLLVFATEDLHVHAVGSADGHRKWRVKPTPNNPGFPNSFAGSWPVVAEKTGVVFLRMRLAHDAGLWGGPPGRKSVYPDTNAETRAFLVGNPALKNLFALNLADGTEAFVPAVGYGGVEDLVGGKPYLNVGPVPVVRKTAGGDEVAYMLFRNGQSKPPDGRWDSHLGEMVLSPKTIPGLEPGDLRFVEFPNSTIRITDEQVPMTMAGDSIFRAHWGASESTRITDRSATLGLTFKEPIKSSAHPPVIRRQTMNSDYDPASHWTKTGLTLYRDGRYWRGPGWWVYWNELDPPTPDRDAYSDGLRPRYTYVSDGLIIVQGNGGELFVLRHAE